MFTKWQVGKKTGWLNGKLIKKTKWQVDKMTFIKWQVDKMTLIKCQVDKMPNWQKDKLTKW
jgi:hypothetical protein